jgi:hypothetical protein
MGKKGQRQFIYRLFSLITGIEANMMPIFFLGLIANLASVCSGCDAETSGVNNFDWNKVGICVLTRF